MAWYSFNQEGVELRESSKASSPFFICESFNLNIILNILDTFHYHVAVFFLIDVLWKSLSISFMVNMYISTHIYVSAMYDLIVSGLLDFIKKEIIYTFYCRVQLDYAKTEIL